MQNETHISRILNWLLTRFPPVPLLTGLLLLYIYNDTQLPWALALCKLSFGVFLLMPGWLLLFSPNTTIALFNAVGLFFSRKSPDRLLPKPIIDKHNWSELNPSVRSFLILVASLAFLVGVVLIYQGVTTLDFWRK